MPRYIETATSPSRKVTAIADGTDDNNSGSGQQTVFSLVGLGRIVTLHSASRHQTRLPLPGGQFRQSPHLLPVYRLPAKHPAHSSHPRSLQLHQSTRQ